MTDNDNIIPFKKPSSKGPGPEEKPEPMSYRFFLKDGSTRDVEGYLAAGASQIIMGDAEGMLIYLVPLDHVQEVIRLDAEEQAEES